MNTSPQIFCKHQCLLELCICILAVNLWLLETLQIFIEHHLSSNNSWETIAFGAFAAIQIALFDEVYTRLALWLNEKENHETDAEYERSLIFKNFSFRFVNSYISLFFVAFLKYVDDCNGTPEDGCFNELSYTVKSQNHEKCLLFETHGFRYLEDQSLTLSIPPINSFLIMKFRGGGVEVGCNGDAFSDNYLQIS